MDKNRMNIKAYALNGNAASLQSNVDRRSSIPPKSFRKADTTQLEIHP